MRSKTYYLSVGMLLGTVTILHLLRIMYRLDAIIGGVEVPMWASWIVVVLAGWLSYKGLRLYARQP